MRVVVTRPAQEAASWVDALAARGFEAVSFPLIEIAPVADAAPLHAAWLELPAMQAAMFVSGNAVRGFSEARAGAVASRRDPAESPGITAAWPPGVRAWATGKGTRDALLAAGVPASAIDAPGEDAAQFDSEALWAQVGAGVRANDRVLIVRGADTGGEPAGRDWLADMLRRAGAQVHTVAAYTRRAPQDGGARFAALRDKLQDAVWLFSSTQGIAHLVELAGGEDWSQARAIATHPRIAQAAIRAGFGVVRESRPGLEAVASALEFFR
jgi:uroporphyrinogen-III synthase